MNIRSSFDVIRNDLKYFGIPRTVYDVAIRLLNRAAFFKTLRVVSLRELQFREKLPPNFHFRRIPIEELAVLSEIPEYEISPVLLEKIGRTQNSCFGIYEGHRLAQYLFFFTEPTLMSEDLMVTFAPHYAYLCSTFTHPDYRGLHLNSQGVALGAMEYQRRGFPVLLAYVESNNFSSLRSLHRIGWKNVGSIYVARIMGRYRIHATKGCEAFSFRLIPTVESIGETDGQAAKRRAS